MPHLPTIPLYSPSLIVILEEIPGRKKKKILSHYLPMMTCLCIEGRMMSPDDAPSACLQVFLECHPIARSPGSLLLECLLPCLLEGACLTWSAGGRNLCAGDTPACQITTHTFTIRYIVLGPYLQCLVPVCSPHRITTTVTLHTFARRGTPTITTIVREGISCNCSLIGACSCLPRFPVTPHPFLPTMPFYLLPFTREELPSPLFYPFTVPPILLPLPCSPCLTWYSAVQVMPPTFPTPLGKFHSHLPALGRGERLFSVLSVLS